MNWIRKTLSLGLMSLSGMSAWGQMSLDESQQKAREHYPLIRQYELIKQIEDYNLSNARTAYLPQLKFTGKASYQSDVTDVSNLAAALGIPVKAMNKDQYALTLDVRQNVWDGGATKAQIGKLKASTEVDRKSLDVELYNLRERVQQVYFGILMNDALIKQCALLREELEVQRKRILSGVKNGVQTEADAATLQVELVKVEQQEQTLRANRKSYIEILALLTGESLEESMTFAEPQAEVLPQSLATNRPELSLITAKQDELTASIKQVKASILPTLGLFAQGGYSRPGLNLLANSFKGYYIVGAQLSWNISSLYTYKNSLRTLSASNQRLESQRATLQQGLDSEVIKQKNELVSLAKKMTYDDEIIRLRGEVKKSAEAKHKAGTITSSELVREINAEAIARQDAAQHRLEWLLAGYKLRHSLGEK